MAFRDKTVLATDLPSRCPGTPQARCGPGSSLLMESFGLAGRHGPQVRLALVLLASIAGWLEKRCVSALHDGMQRRRRESYGRRGLARSGRVVGSREGVSSSAAAGLVAGASANPGGSGHCEWPSAVSGRATTGEAKGGTRRYRDTSLTSFARCVWNGHWVRCERGRLVLLTLARSAARRLGD